MDRESERWLGWRNAFVEILTLLRRNLLSMEQKPQKMKQKYLRSCNLPTHQYIKLYNGKKLTIFFH